MAWSCKASGPVLSELTTYRTFSWSLAARDSGLDLSNRSEIWQAHRQQGGRDAFEIPQRYDKTPILGLRNLLRFDSKPKIYRLVNRGPWHHVIFSDDIDPICWSNSGYKIKVNDSYNIHPYIDTIWNLFGIFLKIECLYDDAVIAWPNVARDHGQVKYIP